MKLKSKYLHIELKDGSLYVYSDDRGWPRHRLVTKDEMDNKCNMGSLEQEHQITIPLSDFVATK